MPFQLCSIPSDVSELLCIRDVGCVCFFSLGTQKCYSPAEWTQLEFGTEKWEYEWLWFEQTSELTKWVNLTDHDWLRFRLELLLTPSPNVQLVHSKYCSTGAMVKKQHHIFGVCTNPRIRLERLQHPKKKHHIRKPLQTEPLPYRKGLCAILAEKSVTDACFENPPEIVYCLSTFDIVSLYCALFQILSAF